MILHFRTAQDDLSSLPVASDLYHHPIGHQANHVELIADLVAQRLLDNVTPLLEPVPPPPAATAPPALAQSVQPNDSALIAQIQDLIALIAANKYPPALRSPHQLRALISPNLLAPMGPPIVDVDVAATDMDKLRDLASTAGPMALVLTPVLTATTPPLVINPLPFSSTCRAVALLVVSGFLPDSLGLS